LTHGKRIAITGIGLTSPNGNNSGFGMLGINSTVIVKRFDG
jgi:hypothetical protein